MKKLLFCLFAILSISAYADVNKSVIFDFADPQSLPETPAAESGRVVDVSDSTYTKNEVTIGFKKLRSTMGALIYTRYSDLYNKYYYWLEVNSNTEINFHCANNGKIDKIEFLNNSDSSAPDLSGLTVQDGYSGSIDQQTKSWNPTTPTGEVVLINKSSHYAKLYKIKVSYHMPSAVLSATPSINTSAGLYSFSGLDLTFSKNVTNKKNINVTYNGSAVASSVTVKGNVATIKLAQTLTQPGKVVVTVPEGSFVDGEGYCNYAQTFTYTIERKKDTFSPSIYPENNTNIPYLQSGDISLVFGKAVSEFKDDNLIFRLFKEGEDAPVCRLKPVHGENSQTVRLEFFEATSDLIKESGFYRISIPAKSFYNFKGDPDYETWNPQIDIRYEVGGTDILIPKVNPANGSELPEFSGLTLTFNEDITYKETENLKVTFGDKPVEFTVTTDSCVAVIALKQKIFTDGEVKVAIPASCFVTAEDLTNAKLNYKFTVKSPLTALTQEANALLAKTGAGYPKETSKAYLLLDSLAKVQTTIDSLKMAIDLYYKETDIQLPQSKEYYELAFVNAVGKKLYVSYANDTVTLSKDPAKASVFATTATENGKVVFKTTDGKFLHVLTANETYKPTTSKACVTNKATEVNNLTLAKLVVGGKEKETLGMMTMYGLLGKSVVTDNELYTYSVANFNNSTFVSEPVSDPYFAENGSLTSALVLTKTAKPDSYVVLKAPTAECNMVDGAYILTLTFDKKQNVELQKDSSKVTVKMANVEKGRDVIIVKTAKAGVFNVKLSNMYAGNYTLSIPEKTLISTVDGEVSYGRKLDVAFKIESLLDADFTEMDGFYTYLKDFVPSGVYACEELNDFGYYIDLNQKFDGVTFRNIYNDTTMVYIAKESNLSKADRARFAEKTDSILSEFQMNYGHLEKADSILVKGLLYRVIPYYAPKDLIPTGKIVKLRASSSMNVLRTGKFVKYETGQRNIKAIKIAFDDGPINPGELGEDDYVLDIEAASFGDAAFGIYQEDQKSIDPRRCVVNVSHLITVKLSGNFTDNIGHVANTPCDQIITDLFGRRVSDTSKPGMYIINGKKVMVK